MEYHVAVVVADYYLECLGRQRQPVLLVRSERVPGSDLLAVHGDAERAGGGDRLALDEAVEHHAEIVGRACRELFQPPTRPAAVWASLGQHAIELLPEHYRARTVVKPFETPVVDGIHGWLRDFPAV